MLFCGAAAMYVTQSWPESENSYKNIWIIFLDDFYPSSDRYPGLLSCFYLTTLWLKQNLGKEKYMCLFQSWHCSSNTQIKFKQISFL